MPRKVRWRWVSDLVAVAYVSHHRQREANPAAFAHLSAEEHIKQRQRNGRELAESLNRVGVLTASGEVINFWTDAFHGAWVDWKTEHFSLRYGTLGTGLAFDEIADLDSPAQQQALARFYGPFLGCPVMVDDEEVSKAIAAKFPLCRDMLPSGLKPEEKAAVASASDQEQPRRRPGKQPLYDGLIKSMVQRQFGPRLSEGGDLVGVKMASVICDGVEWIEKLTGVVVKESTMRDYLALLRRPEVDGK